MTVCDRHRDSSLPFAEWILSMPGMRQMLEAQLLKANIEFKLTHDMIPIFEMSVVPIKVN